MNEHNYIAYIHEDIKFFYEHSTSSEFGRKL
jgi:hypothetical protein